MAKTENVKIGQQIAQSGRPTPDLSRLPTPVRQDVQSGLKGK